MYIRQVSTASPTPHAGLGGNARREHTCQESADLKSGVQDEAAALKDQLNITAVATQHGMPGKTGPAKQVLPDEKFLVKHNVREAFLDCSDRARQRNANRKMTSLKALVTNDGRSVVYTRTARLKLDPAIILRIRCGSSSAPNASS